MEFILQHKGTVTLRTNRLLLHRFLPGDEEAMFQNWTKDPAVSKFMRWAPHQSVQETQEFLGSILRRYQDAGFYRWAIVAEPFGVPIGTIALMPVCENDLCYEVAYCIGHFWWGNGYTAEALQAILEFAFQEVGINRVEAYHSVNNPGSGRVMEKAGMQKGRLFTAKISLFSRLSGLLSVWNNTGSLVKK